MLEKSTCHTQADLPAIHKRIYLPYTSARSARARVCVRACVPTCHKQAPEASRRSLGLQGDSEMAASRRSLGLSPNHRARGGVGGQDAGGGLQGGVVGPTLTRMALGMLAPVDSDVLGITRPAGPLGPVLHIERLGCRRRLRYRLGWRQRSSLAPHQRWAGLGAWPGCRRPRLPKGRDRVGGSVPPTGKAATARPQTVSMNSSSAAAYRRETCWRYSRSYRNDCSLCCIDTGRLAAYRRETARPCEDTAFRVTGEGCGT